MIETQQILLRPNKMHESEVVFSYRSDSQTNKCQSFVPTELKEHNESDKEYFTRINFIKLGSLNRLRLTNILIYSWSNLQIFFSHWQNSFHKEMIVEYFSDPKLV